MNTYVIMRRGAWANPEELEQTAKVSSKVGLEEMPDKVRWIRSYVVKGDDGRLGTVCVYQGTDPDAIREHASRVGMPAHEVIPVEDTVVINEDPQSA